MSNTDDAMAATPHPQDVPRTQSPSQREPKEASPGPAAEDAVEHVVENGATGITGSRKAGEENSEENSAEGTPSTTPHKYYGSRLRRILTPPNCRWDPKSPPPFSTGLCLLYAIVSLILCALYLCSLPVLFTCALYQLTMTNHG